MTDLFNGTILDNCVIGSGPSGVFCSLGLLEKEETVHMVDIGKTLDPTLSDQIKTLSQHSFSDWSSDSYEALLNTCLPKGTSMPTLKPLFGSDYLYDSSTCYQDHTQSAHSIFYSSQSKGGFSKVWGTNVMPFHEHDMVRWPLGLAELEPFYKKVCDHVPYCANNDDLSTYFPLYGDPTSNACLHDQSHYLLQHLNAHKSTLNQQDIFFGYARLMAQLDEKNCHRCGLCLTGCPYDLLYSTDMTLDRLEKHSKFHYHASYKLDFFEEKDHYVLLHCVDQHNNSVTIHTRRLFLATGSLQSSKIVLKSIPALSELFLLDSHHFLLPAYTSTSFQTSLVPHHSLAQLYLDIRKASLSPHWIHLQLYGYNLLYKNHVKHLIKWAYWLSPPLFNYLIGKLWTIQGFLHSDHSSKVKLSYNHTHDTLSNLLITNPNLKSILSSIYKFLKQRRKQTGLSILSGLAKDSTFGSSFHYGGTLPMESSPKLGQTSIQGQLWCSNRIYVVDSSIFPSIPATTITYTLMANAYRIGYNA